MRELHEVISMFPSDPRWNVWNSLYARVLCSGMGGTMDELCMAWLGPVSLPENCYICHDSSALTSEEILEFGPVNFRIRYILYRLHFSLPILPLSYVDIASVVNLLK